MKSILTSRNLISSLAAIPLLVLCFAQLSVRARELGPRWDAAVGNTVSDYLINIKGINEKAVHTRKGTIKPGQTIVAEVNRDQFQYSGDSNTPRLGLTTEITYSLQLAADQIAALGQLPQFPASFELVDNLTGRTTARAGRRFIIFVPTPLRTEGR
jgi:hypothetical protein